MLNKTQPPHGDNGQRNRNNHQQRLNFVETKKPHQDKSRE
jgi:hypothetical protein